MIANPLVLNRNWTKFCCLQKYVFESPHLLLLRHPIHNHYLIHRLTTLHRHKLKSKLHWHYPMTPTTINRKPDTNFHLGVTTTGLRHYGLLFQVPIQLISIMPRHMSRQRIWPINQPRLICCQPMKRFILVLSTNYHHTTPGVDN